MIYVWLSRFLYQATAGPQQRSALSVGCLRGLMSTGRSLTPVDAGVRMWGRGEELTHTNETLLSLAGLHHPQCWKCVFECETERNSMRSARGAYVQWLCVELGMSVWLLRLCVCGEGGVGYFYSCYILWQQCDSTFRSVQTMRLTQRCSPQPQCKLHFLKPVPWLAR